MNELIKWGLILGGGYWLYTKFVASQGTASTSGSSSGNSGSSASATGGGGSSASPPPPPPVVCPPVSFTCPDGTVVKQTGTGSGCWLAPWQCPTTPGGITQTGNDAAALAKALNDRAISDGAEAMSSTHIGGIGADGKTVMYNIWQWNYIMQELHPSAKTLDTGDTTRLMSAAEYVLARATGGVGLSGFRGMGAFVRTGRFNPVFAGFRSRR